jgi:alanine racemase
MGFAPQALIDHAALGHNLQRARTVAPHSRIWAVLKADAYGHGLERVARALSSSDGFAVARIDEAIRLKHAGFLQPILITGGCYSLEELQLAAQHTFEVVLHQRQQVELLDSLTRQQSLICWLKVDTGMHRLGFPPEEIEAIAERLSGHAAVRQLNLMTHLANADDRADETSRRQISSFDAIASHHFTHRSIANSAGLLGFETAHREWVRPGIMLYGVSPFAGGRGEQEALRPVMTLRSRVISVKQCRQGDPIGYGGSFRCPEAMPVAVIAAGYGDGYPRHAVNGTPVLVAGRRLPLAGRVSMDLISVDARDYPQVQVGDEAILWGTGLPVEEIAERAGTIAYELVCGVTRRVEFIDLHADQVGDT